MSSQGSTGPLPARTATVAFSAPSRSLADPVELLLPEHHFALVAVRDQLALLGHAVIDAGDLVGKQHRLVPQPVVTDEDGLVGVVANPYVFRQRIRRQIASLCVAQHRGIAIDKGIFIPPTRPNPDPDMPVLVGKAVRLGQRNLDALEQRLDGLEYRRLGGVLVFLLLRLQRCRDHEILGEPGIRREVRGQVVHEGLMPAGMDDPQCRQVEPKRQGQEPVDGFLVPGRACDLGQEGRVLLIIFVAVLQRMVATQIFAGRAGVRQEPGDGVELVVAHDRLGAARIDHAPDQIDRIELARAAVDKVADKNGLPRRVTPGALRFAVFTLTTPPDCAWATLIGVTSCTTR